MIFLLLFAIPLVIALTAEYLCCRLPKRRFWRWGPFLLTTAGTAAVTLFRYHGWSGGEEKAPLEQLLFIPGLPALGAFLGLWLGWRLWRRMWSPRVVTERERKG